MEVVTDHGLVVIEANPEELVKLATAAAGAATHGEAVVLTKGVAQIAVRMVEGTSRPARIGRGE